MKTTYLPVAETAKLVRAALKRRFPGVTFGVRSKSYSGGCSIRVTWVDGPMSREVDQVAGMFQGRRFDGSIDMAWDASLWLLPDGTACVASDPGSAGSGGYHGAQREWMPHPDAKLISTGAYVFCDRTISANLKPRVAAWIARHGGWEMVSHAHSEESALHLVAQRAKLLEGALMVAKR